MSEAQNQRPDELLWMLWFDEKIYLIVYCVKYNISYKKVHFGNVFVHQVEVTVFYLNQVGKLGEMNY